jgi:hypothetical protein
VEPGRADDERHGGEGEPASVARDERPAPSRGERGAADGDRGGAVEPLDLTDPFRQGRKDDGDSPSESGATETSAPTGLRSRRRRPYQRRL